MPITILKQSVSITTLKDAGPVGLPLSEPTAVTRSQAVALEGAGDDRTGIWEVSVGRFARQLACAEVMHILSGECTFTPEGGEPQKITAGDTLFFPSNTVGVWDVTVPLRKVYVVFA